MSHPVDDEFLKGSFGPIESVEIAICTWNRHKLLQQTIQSIKQIQCPQGIKLSLLVVDNASTDDTPNVIRSFVESDFAKVHPVRSLHESRQGHTFSRNKAIEASNADLIVWTDDDVLLPSTWIQSYVDSADERPNEVFWGGKIEPEFFGGTPKWIDACWEMLQGCFAARDLGDKPVSFQPDRLPYGANFAVRGNVQRSFPFSTELGRRGEAVLGEDELEMMRRLLQHGAQGSWVPGIPVKHLIPKDRTSPEYVRGYFVGQGWALASKGKPWHTDAAALRRESKSEHRSFQLKRFFAKPEVWVSHLIRGALAQGQADYLEQIQQET